MAHAKLCAVTDCDKPVSKRGFCNAHYLRFRRHGDPLAGSGFRLPAHLTCSVEGCDAEARALGLCNRHYQRQQIHGDPLAGGTEKNAVKEWIENHANYDGPDCLLWPFARSDGGYGRLEVDGRLYVASRYMCILAHGEPPTPEHEAAHNCGNGAGGCVHPGHLRWDTTIGNEQDKVTHGTSNRGERGGGARLTETQVREIRALQGTIPQWEIA